MRKISTKVILPILLALLTLTATVGITYTPSALADTLAEQKNQLSSLKDRYSRAAQNTQELKNQIAAKRSQIQNKRQEKDVLDAEVTVLTEEIMLAEALIEEYTASIAEKETEKQELLKKQETQQEMLGEMLRMSYKYGDESYIDIILGSQSISDFIQRVDFLAYHMNYSSTLLREMKETGETLNEVTANLSSTLDAMNIVREETEKTKAELEEKLARVDVIIAELNADVSELDSELAQKERDRLALERDVQTLTKQIQEQEAKNGGTVTPAYDGGQLGWPLKGYSMKYLTSSYGTRTDPITGKKGAFHNGLDVGAPHGTKILAAESGTVVRASWYSSYGNCVIIDHGGGLMTLYAHCSGYNVTVGQQVSRGDVVAYVGTTGRSTGNHLHFTVFINGKTVDPGNYLS